MCGQCGCELGLYVGSVGVSWVCVCGQCGCELGLYVGSVGVSWVCMWV